MKNLADIIVFDIVDELSDEEGFDAWWHELGPEKRYQLTEVMAGCVTSNIKRQREVDMKRVLASAIGGTGGCQSS